MFPGWRAEARAAYGGVACKGATGLGEWHQGRASFHASRLVQSEAAPLRDTSPGAQHGCAGDGCSAVARG
jgi:hypothetical protein